MNRLEKEVLILNLRDRGPYSQAKLKVVEADFRVTGKKDSFFFAINLPRELARSEWDIFKVWRKLDVGKIIVEEKHVLSESPELTVDMKQRESFRHDLVLVNGRTGTTLVIQQ